MYLATGDSILNSSVPISRTFIIVYRALVGNTNNMTYTTTSTTITENLGVQTCPFRCRSGVGPAISITYNSTSALFVYMVVMNAAANNVQVYINNPGTRCRG